MTVTRGQAATDPLPSWNERAVKGHIVSFVPADAELLDYLEANGFPTWIVPGGGVEFMRAFAQAGHGIPSERVIGSSINTTGRPCARSRRNYCPGARVWRDNAPGNESSGSGRHHGTCWSLQARRP